MQPTASTGNIGKFLALHFTHLHLFPYLKSWNTNTFPTSLLETCLRPFPWATSPHWPQALKERKRKLPQTTAWELFAEDSQQGSCHFKLIWLTAYWWFLTSFSATLLSEHAPALSTTGALLRSWVDRAMKFLFSKRQMTKRIVYSPKRPKLTSPILIFISSSFLKLLLQIEAESPLTSSPLFKYGKYLANWYGGLTK